MSDAAFIQEAQEAIEAGIGRMGFFWSIVERKASQDELRAIASRYYAEIRTFIDLKLPERMRLCPLSALEARKFFWRIYRDEHGEFETGRDHPSLWKKFCRELGIEDAELENQYHAYARKFEYMRKLEPSEENMVTELATMAAWESVVPVFASAPYEALRDHYGISDDGLEFFTLHQDVDGFHSKAALEMLARFASTRKLQDHALRAIEQTLRLDSYFS